MKNNDNFFDISPKEALKILNNITHIVNLLHHEDQREAFYHLGIFTESLAEIVRKDDETKST